MKPKLLLAAIMIAASFSSYAGKVTINVSDYAFSPSATVVNMGDTVMFLWTGGNHTTTSTNVPAGAATWDSPLTQTQQTFVYVPTVMGDYFYDCTPHAAMGMKGQFRVTYPTSVPQIQNHAVFQFWPNPANAATHIRFNENQKEVTVCVTDIAGTIVLSHDYTNVTDTDIDISTLPQGRYLLYATTGNNIYTENLVVE